MFYHLHIFMVDHEEFVLIVTATTLQSFILVPLNIKNSTLLSDLEIF